MTVSFKFLAFCVFIFGFSSPAPASRTTGFPIFHEETRYALGGEGHWDYLTVDPDSNRLFIARSDRIMVVDRSSGKLLHEIPETDGAHGIALVPKENLGFATGGRSGLVTVFDLKNLNIKGHIEAGQGPDALTYDPASESVFVFNGKSHDASVINPKTRKVVATIPLNGKPEFAVSDHEGKVFVNLEDKSQVAEIDSRALKLVKTYPLKPCEEPTGLAIDVKTHRLIVGCSNKVAVILDAKSGKILNTFDVGAGVDGAAFNPKQRLAFISAGEGRLTILHESKHRGFEHFQDLPTAAGARTLAVDEKTGKVFLATAQFGPPESPAPGHEHARKSIVPGTFFVLVVGQ